MIPLIVIFALIIAVIGYTVVRVYREHGIQPFIDAVMMPVNLMIFAAAVLAIGGFIFAAGYIGYTFWPVIGLFFFIRLAATGKF